MGANRVGGRDKVTGLVTLRDLRDVVASFEMLYRKTSALGQVTQEANMALKFKTALGRAVRWRVALDFLLGSSRRGLSQRKAIAPSLKHRRTGPTLPHSIGALPRFWINLHPSMMMAF